ncbi:MAG: 2-hydroxy-6-oxo-6-phenylhexa-2,4-dienoate hydrolase (EC [uncultured Sulfurovum sp.]|uniref:2-hydroxy-6-oxo-6-phenylhexa-2,4-dienoate hydrolase (EC) n=1 Tax=uncultured Sulfurovum sp. TaxID=269237 RepID=A0A6S6TGY6_9BACT|nr:MAG: 2-hydroxy-6-oxo-6-phenylhexa-2,4-dienoate hydrolase (EC [uncultured Sulfurovum sp.]
MFRHIMLLLLILSPLCATEYFGINLEKYKYPYEVKEFNLTVQKESLTMTYMDLHPKQPNGKSVLLLHGKNFTGAYWETTAKRLTEEGYRVIMPDQVGFGKSSKPEHLQYSFQMFAHNTAQLMDHLKISKSHLIGHSMGGMLATRYALMFSERVEKLILENPIGLEDWQRFVSNPSFDFWYKRELSKTAKKIHNYQLKSYYDGKWKEKYQPWVDILASFTLGKDYPKYAWNQALISQMIFTQPVCYQFDQLSMPVLLIIGQRDKTALGKGLASPEIRKNMGDYPKLGVKTQNSIPNAKLLELEGIGHMPHIEDFDTFIKNVLKFLSKD